jgi:hypothetical protein
MLIEGADPAGYKAIVNLFAPPAGNQQRWSPKVKSMPAKLVLDLRRK